MPWITEQIDDFLSVQLQQLMEQTVAEARRRICAKPKRVLLLPPDITRMHSAPAGLPNALRPVEGEADVHVIPTLGQHVPHSPEENRQMFGSIPNERIHAHDWRGGSSRWAKYRPTSSRMSRAVPPTGQSQSRSTRC